MRPPLAALLALALLAAAVPSTVAQEDDEPPFAIVQETEDHYVVEVDLPAAVFQPGSSTQFDLPGSALEIEGAGDEESYRLRVILTPNELGSDGVRLEDEVWEVEAWFVSETTEAQLPALPQLEGDVLAPTLEQIIAQLDEVFAELDGTMTSLQEAEQGLPTGEPGGLEGAPIDPTQLELVTGNLGDAQEDLNATWTFLNETFFFLNSTTGEGPIGVWTGGLEPAERSLAIAQAVLLDAHGNLQAARNVTDELPNIGDPEVDLEPVMDNVTELLGELNQTRRDLQDHARELAAYGDNETREARAWVNETIEDQEDPQETAQRVLEQVNETVYSVLPADDGNDTDEDDEGEPIYTPEDPIQPPYDTLKEVLLGALNLTDEHAPNTTAELTDLVEWSMTYLNETDERLNWTVVWLQEHSGTYQEETVDPFTGHASERAITQIERAQADLETVRTALVATQEELAPGDDEAPEEDPEEEPEDGDGNAADQLIGALEDLDLSQEDLEAAIATLEEATEDPTQLAGLTEDLTSRPTTLKVYIPKQISTDGLQDPTIPDPSELPGQDDDPEPEVPSEEDLDETVGDLEDDAEELPGEDDLALPGEEDGDEGDDDLGLPSEGPDVPLNGEDDGDDDDGEGTDEGSADDEDDDGEEGTSEDNQAPSVSVDLSPSGLVIAENEQKIVDVIIENTGDQADTFHLTAEHEGPITVDTIDDTETTLEPGSRTTMRLRVTPTDSGQAQLGALVTGDSGGVEEAHIDVDVTEPSSSPGGGNGNSGAGGNGAGGTGAGQGASQGELRVDINPFSVKLGTQEDGLVRVEVRNDGQAEDTARLSPDADGPLQAQVEGSDSVRLAPGEARNLEVRLTPEDQGSGSVTITVSSDNGGEVRPVLLVDIVDQAAMPGDDRADQGQGAEKADDQASQEDEESSKGLPLPGLLPLVALGLAALRRRHQGGGS